MNKKIQLLTEYEFHKVIKKGDKPILICFYAKWCTPCKMQEPILLELYEVLNKKVDFYKIDIDECESLALSLKVDLIPCLLVYLNGEIKEKSVGLTSLAELSQMLIKYV